VQTLLRQPAMRVRILTALLRVCMLRSQNTSWQSQGRSCLPVRPLLLHAPSARALLHLLRPGR
jgi:hypothetical protein